MTAPEEYDDYVHALREEVCSHCIERVPGGPPCAPHGKPCGIEQHVPKLVEICRTTDSVLIDPYIERLHELICPECAFKDKPACPCPLEYLLQLAVEAVERVERDRVEGRAPSNVVDLKSAPASAPNSVPGAFGYEI